MNKIFLVAVLFLLIGFGAGALIYKDKKEPVEISNTQNKLFELFDLFKNYPGHVSVTKVDESLGLMIVRHPAQVSDISNEGNDAPTSYTVYDYRNDKIYKNLGLYGLGGGEYPEGIINDNRILILKGGDGIEYKLAVQDFNGQIIEELPVKLFENSKIEVGTTRNGYLSFWIIDSGSSNGSYKLDTKTLELTKN